MLTGSPATLSVARNSFASDDAIAFSDGDAGGFFDPPSLSVGAKMLLTFTHTQSTPGTYTITATSAAGGLVFGSPLAIRVVEPKPPAEPRPPDPIPRGAFAALLALRNRSGAIGRV